LRTFPYVKACQSQAGESPAAAYSAVDPSLGAVFRMSGMAKCQTVKDMVLSRGRSHVPKDMARGGIGIAERRSGVEACSVLQPEEFGKLRLVVRVSGDKGQKPVKGQGWSRIPPCQKKVGLAKRRSASQLKGWWVNSPLEADRVAVVVVPVPNKDRKPRGLIAHLPNRPGFGICRRRRAAAVKRRWKAQCV
jgi:hypothetical protein